MVAKPETSQKFVVTIFHILALVWRVYPLASVGSLCITILQGLVPLANALILKMLFDWLSLRLTDPVSVTPEMLYVLLITQALITVAAALLTAVNTYLQSELGRRLELQIQQDVYTKINDLSGLAPFENPQIYDTIRLAEQGALSSAQETLPALTRLLENLVALISFIGTLISFHFLLAGLIILSVIPRLFIDLRLVQQQLQIVFAYSLDERRKLFYSSMLAGAPSAKEIRLFDLGNFFLEKLCVTTRRIHTAERHLNQRELRWEALLGLCSSLLASVAFGWVALAGLNGQITMGDIALYVNVVGSTQGALQGAVAGVSGLFESVLFYSSFQALQQLSSILPAPKNPRATLPLQQGIEFRNVSFRYHDDLPWILRDINLTIPVGQCIALVGVNGAGKTTLVKLLTRMYDPTEGQILWDGIDIRQFEVMELRARMGAIFQDFMRYDLTVRENIGLGDLNRIHDQNYIQQVAQQAHIDDMIAALPKGYETEVSRMFAEEGEGFDLSGGQWQKVATARMFMRNANILILDEPTSALDAEAEYETHMQFRALLAGRTGLLIAHRFNTVRMAHLIAVLDNGQITEYGTHETLMERNGIYARLYRLQASGYEHGNASAICSEGAGSSLSVLSSQHKRLT